jgi:hypothetical protein
MARTNQGIDQIHRFHRQGLGAGSAQEEGHGRRKPGMMEWHGDVLWVLSAYGSADVVDLGHGIRPMAMVAMVG